MTALPAAAGDAERRLAALGDLRLASLPPAAGLAALWNPATCPPEWIDAQASAWPLPWWDAGWSVAKKRAHWTRIVEWLSLAGTHAGVVAALEAWGAPFDVARTGAWRIRVRVGTGGRVTLADRGRIRHFVDASKRGAVHLDGGDIVLSDGDSKLAIDVPGAARRLRWSAVDSLPDPIPSLPTLALTAAATAALADAANTVAIAAVALGDGSGGNAALASQRERLAAGGALETGGEAAGLLAVAPAGALAYECTEIGVLATTNGGGEWLAAYWSDADDAAFARVAGDEHALAVRLRLADPAATVTVPAPAPPLATTWAAAPSIPDASETVQGLAELATTAEAEARSAGDVILTPETLKESIDDWLGAT